MFPSPRTLALTASCALLAATAAAQTADLDQVVAQAAGRQDAAQASQQRIDQVVSETDAAETEYKQVMKQLDGLAVYNTYLERQIAGQEQELAQLAESLDQVGVVERQIMPLMIRMLDGLEQFVELDKPFLMDERRGRIARLRALMERSDVTLAEKFRSLTEAFQIENDFGRTIEVYKDTLDLDGRTIEVDVLRLGRVSLYYQSTDASVTGRWDPDTGQWMALTDSKARNQVRQGLRIARKLVAPDLLLLEVPAPEVAP